MVVQHNLRAMNSNRMLGLTNATQSKSTEKLSSGYKINRAADDAAGLSISEKMRRQIRGLSQASLNAQEGISMVQAAEGALTEVHDMLQRMSELSVKAETGTLTEVDRDYIDQEVQQLMTEITRVADNTSFNEKKLLDGSLKETTVDGKKVQAINIQVDAEASKYISFSIGDMSARDTGLDLVGQKANATWSADNPPVIVTTGATNAAALNAAVKDAITKVSNQRSMLGAVQNRLEHTVNNLDNVVENTTAAESQIRDTDMASEMVKYSNNNILAQAGQAMLAQSNQANQGVLALLQ